MNLALIFTYLPMLLKTFVGMNVSKDVADKGLGDRPWYMSRRFGGGVITAVATIIATISGNAVPTELVATATDIFGQLVDLGVQNKALFGSAWGFLLMVWGLIMRQSK